MFFYWDYVINGFLFENFNIDTLTKCLVVIFIVFVLAFLNEAIKILQKIINKKLELKWNNNPSTNDRINMPGTSSQLEQEATETTSLVRPLHIPVNNQEIKRRRLIVHSIQSLIYMLNLTIAYFLMNIAMCYYAGHFIAIIIGFGFGYYFLHIISPDFEDSLNSKSHCSSNEINSNQHTYQSFSPEEIN